MHRKNTITRQNLKIHVPPCQGILDDEVAGKFMGIKLNAILADYLDGKISNKQAVKQFGEMFEIAICLGCPDKDCGWHKE